MDKIDKNIKLILQQLREAHKKSEKYLAQQIITGEKIITHDFFNMALAFDNENLLLIEYELLLSKQYPKHYNLDQINFLEKEKTRLIKNIARWKNRQF